MLSVLHNPSATTILTIWKETCGTKWTAIGALTPIAFTFAVTFAVARLARLWPLL